MYTLCYFAIATDAAIQNSYGVNMNANRMLLGTPPEPGKGTMPGQSGQYGGSSQVGQNGPYASYNMNIDDKLNSNQPG